MKRRSLVLVTLGTLVTAAVATAADPPDPIKPLTAGFFEAANALFESRSGWSWSSPDSIAPTLVGTLAPMTDRTQVVNVTHDHGLIVPCVRVTLATDAAGVTTWTLEVDEDMIDDHFELKSLKGVPLMLVPDTRAAP